MPPFPHLVRYCIGTRSGIGILRGMTVSSPGLGRAHRVSRAYRGPSDQWEEYTYPIFNWAHQQNAIAGFVHMQYLDNNIPQSLTLLHPDRISGRSGVGVG